MSQLKSIEHQIAELTLEALVGAGFDLSQFVDGQPVFERLTDVATVMREFPVTDQDVIHVHRESDNMRGWVLLVWGNDEDVIADYTTNLEDVLRPVFVEIEQVQR